MQNARIAVRRHSFFLFHESRLVIGQYFKDFVARHIQMMFQGRKTLLVDDRMVVVYFDPF